MQMGRVHPERVTGFDIAAGGGPTLMPTLGRRNGTAGPVFGRPRVRPESGARWVGGAAYPAPPTRGVPTGKRSAIRYCPGYFGYFLKIWMPFM